MHEGPCSARLRVERETPFLLFFGGYVRTRESGGGDGERGELRHLVGRGELRHRAGRGELCHLVGRGELRHRVGRLVRRDLTLFV